MALKQHLLLTLESETIYPVTLSNVNPLSFSSKRSKIGFLKTVLSNVSPTNRLRANFQLNMSFFMAVRSKSGSTCPVTLQCKSLQQQLMTDSCRLFARETLFRVFQGSQICNSDYFYYTLFICIQVSMCLCASLWAQGVGCVCIRRSEDVQ